MLQKQNILKNKIDKFWLKKQPRERQGMMLLRPKKNCKKDIKSHNQKIHGQKVMKQFD
jgi:hypothetical protein